MIAITATMMMVEITAGLAFGSMALLADGLHMASHTAALGISAFAYIYARRHARDEQFSFGTGKVNSLAGFAGAILLAVFAVMMAWESIDRLLHPIEIVFNWAILVAVAGLIVNGTSMWILGRKGHDNTHHHDHDHNLRSAYLHVLADTLTSVTAIGALLAGKYFGLVWMDPLMGIVGSILVAFWSVGLLRTTSAVLLDKQGPEQIREKIRSNIEAHDDDRVTDLHLWMIGPQIYAAEVAVVTQHPKNADHYKQLLPPEVGLVHVTISVHRQEEPSDQPVRSNAKD